MAATKEELSQQINAIFAETTDVKNLEEAAQARKKLSDKLAAVIDQHVQYHVGVRMEEILGSIRVDSLGESTVNIQLVQAAGYNNMIRKS